MTSIIPGQNKPLEPVLLQEQEIQSIKQLESILEPEDTQLHLVGANGETIPIPESVDKVLRKVVQAMASGKLVSIVIQEQEFTTQQAADFLNVSRPYLIKLLEQGEIPYIMVGTHRRVRFEDLQQYKQQRDSKRRKFLQELIEMTEEAGLYEDAE
ncbi:helix-turn-helix domain-containing protein [Nostoc sp. FACHB-87]|uniref:helix-turn-helix domain-containing protein n=1 Tax=Nostocaceae TaxID=1162 RepID=UPI00168797C4|nr:MULTISPECIES: helix-turn-helix domain-containing protein [Nostocaceae]MBD2297434.1 helix-turn-helix domain-containing protein [Nostoc sp. FACHB-190]MBD2452728.1 helix-turn-helix domain-containing protein [Nostoc sp. FACHB-87]MBD2473659.1 helix-turn-helix domain-containing protein [Anabaena sp. FACHB-83]